MVLVTGGTGMMGSVLVRRLHEAGHAVRVLTLPGDPHIARIRDCAADIRYGDISNGSDMETVCEGVHTVYHLAAIISAFDDRLYRSINVDGTRNVVEAAESGGAGHFVHVSSASVVYPRPTPYSLSKRESEHIVRSSGIPATIIRPTLVYDQKGGQEFNEFLSYLQMFPAVPFIGSGKARKRPVFVEDVIDGLLKLCGSTVAVGKTYNFSGSESITMYEFSQMCLRLMGMGGKPVLKIPVWCCEALASIMKLMMKRPPLRWPVIAGVTQDADLDPSQAIRELGYAPSGVSVTLPSCFPRQRD